MENSSLSNIVKDYRAKKGISQEFFAELTGLSLRTVQRIESGETVPRGDTLRRLAFLLEVKPDEIINQQTYEDNNILILLNISQLAFLVFPLLGLLIPLVIWVFSKNRIKNVEEHGKAILNFQITWIILLVTLSISFILSELFHFSFPFEITFIFVFGGLYIISFILIVVNTIRTIKGKSIIYKPAFVFLR